MAVNYKDCKPDADGRYGPTSTLSLYYKPNPVHNPNAADRAHKTRWILEPPGQFCVFDDAVVNSRHIEGYGYLGIDVRENLKPSALGENKEVLAVFHEVKNKNEPWHGNPEKSNRLNNVFDDIIENMIENKLISKSYGKRILEGRI